MRIRSKCYCKFGRLSSALAANNGLTFLGMHCMRSEGGMRKRRREIPSGVVTTECCCNVIVVNF